MYIASISGPSWDAVQLPVGHVRRDEQSITTHRHGPFAAYPGILRGFSADPSPVTAGCKHPRRRAPMGRGAVPRWVTGATSTGFLLCPIARLSSLNRQSGRTLIDRRLYLDTLGLRNGNNENNTTLNHTHDSGQQSIRHLNGITLGRQTYLLRRLGQRILGVTTTLLTRRSRVTRRNVYLTRQRAALDRMVNGVNNNGIARTTLTHRNVLISNPDQGRANRGQRTLRRHVNNVRHTLLILLRILIVDGQRTLRNRRRLRRITVSSTTLTTSGLNGIKILLLQRSEQTNKMKIKGHSGTGFKTQPRRSLLKGAQRIRNRSKTNMVRVRRRVTIKGYVRQIKGRTHGTGFNDHRLAVRQVTHTNGHNDARQTIINNVGNNLRTYGITHRRPKVHRRVVQRRRKLDILRIHMTQRGRLIMLLNHVRRRVTRLGVNLRRLLNRHLSTRTHINHRLIITQASNVRTLANLTSTAHRLTLSKRVGILIISIRNRITNVSVLFSSNRTLNGHLLILNASSTLNHRRFNVCLETNSVLLVRVFISQRQHTGLLHSLNRTYLGAATPGDRKAIPFLRVPGRTPGTVHRVTGTVFRPLILRVPRHIQDRMTGLREDSTPYA